MVVLTSMHPVAMPQTTLRPSCWAASSIWRMATGPAQPGQAACPPLSRSGISLSFFRFVVGIVTSLLLCSLRSGGYSRTPR